MGPAEIAHGPMLIGYMFNVLLYGVMITQVHLYFSTFNTDAAWIKFLVTVLLLCDTLNVVFDTVYLYDALIIHFDQPSYLVRATWVFATDPALTGIIAALVQSLFAWRIRILTRKWWPVALVVIPIIPGFFGGIATAVEVGRIPEFTRFQDFKWVVILWLTSECLCDILITAILVWHLVTLHRIFLKTHKTGFEASDALINRIISLTLGTGLATSICASVDLILFLASTTGLHLIFNFPLSKLYTNSLLSTLNSRTAAARRLSVSNGSGTRRQSTHVYDPCSSIEHARKNSVSTYRPSPYARQQDQSAKVMVTIESQRFLDVNYSAARRGSVSTKSTGQSTSADPNDVEAVPFSEVHARGQPSPAEAVSV